MAKHLAAYTLLEITVVLGIFLGISLLVIPGTIQQLQSTSADQAAKDLSSILFTAQQKAYSSLANKSYGVAFFSNKFTMFIGTTLASAESSEDEVLPRGLIVNPINLTGSAQELDFAAGTFRPTKSGQISITNGIDTYVVDINSEGFVYMYKQ